MSKATLDESYWAERYDKQETKWNIGYISTPLKTYFDTLEDKHIKILIPGAGNSYEAEYLHQQGFTQVHVVDFAQTPLENLKKRCPSFPEKHLIKENFFDLKGKYDLIIEQTFFCALDPSLRKNYVRKVKDLLKQEGKLVGLLFTNVLLGRDEPPFGATEEEYLALLEDSFHIEHFALAQNSIPQRQGSEYFLSMRK